MADAFTREIIRNKLLALTNEMGAVLARTSMSPIVYEVLDFACGICDAAGRVVAQDNGLCLFTGTFRPQVESILAKYPLAEMRPGDLYMTNSPYGGGTHNADVALIQPIFAEERVLAFGISVTHWTEVGGKVLGSLAPDSTEIYQEGLQFPQLRLSRAGVMNEAIVEIIRANVRLPQMSIGDLNAGVAAGRIADERLREIVARYGLAAVEETFAAMLDHGEALARAALARIPAGVYQAEEVIDGDGVSEDPIPIRVTVTVEVDRFVADFTGCSPQTAGPINRARGALMSACKTIFKAIIAPQQPSNEGLFRPFELIAPEGTVFTAVRPAPTGWYYEASAYATELVWKALAPVLPDRLSAGSYVSLCAYYIGGRTSAGDYWVLATPQDGGWGACADRDGESPLIATTDGDTYNYPAEVIETAFPLTMLRNAYNVEAGGGAGRQRGGFGTIREYRVDNPTGGSLLASLGRSVHAPWGIDGGESGTVNYYEIVRANGETVCGGRVTSLPLATGDIVRIVTGNGGGWGPPADRDPAAVQRDLADGLISPELAAGVYRVEDAPMSEIRVAVDIGGTFTDLVVYDPERGETYEAKASTTPDDFARGVFDAIAAGDVAPAAIAHLVHGTTVVINTITQRAGVTTALVTTAGFRDALAIGRGNRPDMYNLQFHKPAPFVPRRLRFEIRERVTANGAVTTPLTECDLDSVVAACKEAGVEAIAVCFLHAYAHPDHEQRQPPGLRQRLPGVAITISSEITKEWREYERSSTAVLNAYVHPILDRYLTTLEDDLRDQGVPGQLFAMLSNGGTATFASARRQPIQLVESGPAGGIIGAALIGELLGEPNLISLDIGGTTAKCSLIEGGEIKISGDYRLEWTPLSPGYPVRIPVVDIVEIGAGGGSIAWFDEGGALRVGPRSAGAAPGPAAYGRGGVEPTVTDAMVIAGVIDPDTFLGGRLTLDPDLARRAYAPIAERLGVTIEGAASGVIRLVNEATIDALKLVSVRRGYDPRDFSLVAFGGGGPMHAAALAAELGVKRLIVPPFPGTFSAWGMLMTQPRVDLVQTRVTRLDATSLEDLAAIFADLEAEATARLVGQGFDPARIGEHRRGLDMRYHGQEHTVRVPVAGTTPDLATLETAFHERHRQSYTFALVGTPIEIVHFRTISTVSMSRPSLGQRLGSRNDAIVLPVSVTRPVDFGDGDRKTTAIFVRSALSSGFVTQGPAIVEEPSATTVILPGQQVAVDGFGNLIVTPAASGTAT